MDKNLADARRQKILSIIETRGVKTQKQLSLELEKEGFVSTQATLSRDIRALGLIKRESRDGYVYAQAAKTGGGIVKEAVLSLDLSGTIAVVKTKSGMAMAVATAIDASNELRFILGVIAGDDTIFCALPEKHIKNVFSRLKKWTGL